MKRQAIHPLFQNPEQQDENLFEQDPYAQEYAEDEYADDYGQQVPNGSNIRQQQSLPEQQEQSPYNPYYKGIETAIAEMRERIKQTSSQQNRALRSGLLAFGDSIGGMERERGFKNNLLSAGRALSPAIRAYDAQGSQDDVVNNEQARYMIAHKKAQEDAMREEEYRERKLAAEAGKYQRDEDYRNAALAETRRYHDMKAEGVGGAQINSASAMDDSAALNTLTALQNAKAKVIKLGDRGSQGGMFNNLLDNFKTKTPERHAIHTIGQTLKFDQFLKGMTNTEFEELPSISDSNTVEGNIAILDELIARVNQKLQRDDTLPIYDDTPYYEEAPPQSENIRMRNKEGREIIVDSPDLAREARLDGFKAVR